MGPEPSLGGTTQPTATNASGQIVGFFQPRRPAAFLYSGGTFTAINLLA
jgi:hypothetical protein